MRLPCEIEELEKVMAASSSTTAVLEPVVSTMKAAVVGSSTNNIHDNVDSISDSNDNLAPLVASIAKQLIPVAAALIAAGTAKTASALSGVGVVKAEVKTVAGAASPAASLPPYDVNDVLCSTAAPISFGTPRGKFDVHCLKDSFVLESTTPKGTTTYVVRHEHVRRLMALEVGDSNNTTNVVVAIDPQHAIVAGKQKLSSVLVQARSKDKPIVVVKRSAEVGADARLDGEESPVAALVAMMEMATVGMSWGGGH